MALESIMVSDIGISQTNIVWFNLYVKYKKGKVIKSNKMVITRGKGWRDRTYLVSGYKLVKSSNHQRSNALDIEYR